MTAIVKELESTAAAMAVARRAFHGRLISLSTKPVRDEDLDSSSTLA